MSWLKSASGQEPERYVEPEGTEKVPDPSIPGRMVSTKNANKPFLAYRDHREKQKALHDAWLEKKKVHDEKVAKGEKVEPLERDPTAVREINIWDLFKFILWTLLCLSLAGKFVTGSYTWEYQGKWAQLKTYFPMEREPGTRLFSERMLREFDGSYPGRPIYLAIDGDVYDVSEGRAYQPGGSYAIMAGKDAARSFGTGCFKEHQTHDLRGLTESELAGVQKWKAFYRDSDKYPKVGRVSHKPIDPESPIPVHCKAPKDVKKETKPVQEAASTTKAPVQEHRKSDEL